MVLVDYPEQASSPYTVMETARWLNEKNIRHFLGREPIMLPPTIVPPQESTNDRSSASEVIYTLVILTATVMIATVTMTL